MGIRKVTDQMGRTVLLPEEPRRIVSLVPSQTELLHDLGLEASVAGITRFCIHPEVWYQTKPRVGGTKDPDLDKIRALQPDLIIGNKEENTPATIAELERDYPVWMSDIRSLGDALEMIERLGELTNREAAAGVIAATLRDDFSRLSYETSALPSRSVLYLIWRNPWMAAGHDTFIDAMLRQAGWLNVAGHLDRYPAQPLKAWSELQPELVFLSSEPYPFRDRHLAEVRSAFPGARAMLVDGEMFSWYGSRLLSAPDYFRSLTKAIHDSD